MITCEKCGAAVSEDQAFCQNCGSPTSPEASTRREDSSWNMSATVVGQTFKPTPPSPPPPAVARPKPNTSPPAPQTTSPSGRAQPGPSAKNRDWSRLYIVLAIIALLFISLMVVVPMFTGGRP